MKTLWDLVLTFIAYLPWLAIGAMAGWSLSKRKDSKMLLLQALGAAGMFVLGLAEWFVLTILGWMNQYGMLYTSARTIFGFLLFVSLAMFAAGYCLERFKNRKAISVTATVVDPAAK